MRASFSTSIDRETFLDEWKRLYGLSAAQVFLSPAWIENWLAVVPDDIGVGCARVFDDLRGVYAIALVGMPARKSFLAPLEAKFHESGVDALDRIYLEYNDILIAADAPEGAREAAIAEIVGALPAVEEFVVRNATPAFASALKAAADQHGLTFRSLLSQPTFQIDLTDSGNSVIEGYSSSLRAKVRRAVRRYQERGPVQLQRAETRDERTVAWTELMRLHSQTWSRRGKKGVFGEPMFSGFHERLIDRHAAMVDLVRLTVGAETVGVLYNLVAGDRVYNYQSGFRYEADNQLVPGFVCHTLAAERYRAEGFAIYDMMGGDAEYKQRLCREGETLETIVMTRPSLRMKVRAAAKSLIRSPDARTRRT
jgi:CelD/BcsL family acetyltransferase involved in cellulose biosynthesis